MILKNGYLHDLRTWFNFSTWRFVLCILLLNYISWLLIFEKLFTVPLENKLKSGAYNDTVNITHYVIQSNYSVLLGNCNCLHVHTSIWSLCKLQITRWIYSKNKLWYTTHRPHSFAPPPLLLLTRIFWCVKSSIGETTRHTAY